MEGRYLLHRRIFCSLASTPTAASLSTLTSLLAAGRFYASVKLATSILHSYRRPVSRIVDLFHEIAAAGPSTHPYFLCDAASALIVASTRLRLPDSALRLLSVLAADMHLPMPSLSSCGVLMDGLMTLGRYEDVLKTFDILTGAGVICNDTAVFKKVLRACIAAGDVDQAVYMLEHGHDLDISCYNLVLRALWSVGRGDEAHDIFYSIPVGQQSTKTYNIMINGCCRKNDIMAAKLLRCSMVADGFLPDTVTYNTLILAFLCCGMMQEAGALLGEVITRNMTLDRFSRSLIFELLGKMQDSQDLLFLLQRSFDKGVMIDSYTCGVIVNCLCKAGKVIAADKLFRKLLKAGLTPTRMIYNMIIDGYFLVGNVQGAVDVFQEMSHCPIGFDSVTCNTFVKGFCSQGMVNEAWDMICAMEKNNVRPTIEAFNTMINSLGKLGKLKECVMAFNVIKEKGLQPNAISYGALMNALCKFGRLPEALCLLKEMITRNIRMDSQVFHILIDAFIESGDITGASYLRRAMKTYGIHEDIVTINLDVKLKCKEGDIAAAEGIVLRLTEPPLLPDVITYSTIISACCRAKRIDSAVMFYQQMLKRAIRPPYAIYQLLLNSLEALGRSIDADRVYNEMVHNNIIRTQLGASDALFSSLNCKSAVACSWVYCWSMLTREILRDATLLV